MNGMVWHFLRFCSPLFLCFLAASCVPTKKTARPADCEPIAIRQRADDACEKQSFTGHDLVLEFLEPAEGEWVPLGKLSITSWYNEATVSYIDLLGDGRKVAMVQFEGNVGTGVRQDILAMIGWFDGKFRLLALESLSFYIDRESGVQDLKVAYRIENPKIDRPLLRLHYSYLGDEGAGSGTKEWEDVLEWDAGVSVFRARPAAIEGANPKIRERIRSVRAKVLAGNIDPHTIDLEILGQLGLLNVLDAQEQD